jgi:hypothetical protein
MYCTAPATNALQLLKNLAPFRIERQLLSTGLFADEAG